jgi:hypothetical protein
MAICFAFVMFEENRVNRKSNAEDGRNVRLCELGVNPGKRDQLRVYSGSVKPGFERKFIGPGF